MKKYRFKTKEEFIDDDLWLEDSYSSSHDGYPQEWCEEGGMNKYLGEEIPSKFNKHIEQGHSFDMSGWTFRIDDVTEVIEPEISIEEALNQVKQLNQNSLKTKKAMATKTKNAVKNPVAEKFVFMDKTVSILNVGFSTAKNVILYGPGE
jgi:hypothetical protein